MNIKIKSLKTSDLKEKSREKGYLYKDVSFDLEPTIYNNSQLNRKEYLKDIQANFDEEAIKISISNIFLTSPGQKILNPTFGLDMRRYLFEPISEFISILIGDDIENKLPDQEPRITVEDVSVIPDFDNQEYRIFLQINVPSLNITGLSIKSKLNSIGYTIL